MKICRNKLKYSLDIQKKIIEHEERTLKLYSKTIEESYKDVFEGYGYDLEIGLEWEGIYISSKERIKFTSGYSCKVYCEVQKKGKLVEVSSDDGEVDFYPLWAVWSISGLDFWFKKQPYFLFSDINEVYESMDELLELLEKSL